MVMLSKTVDDASCCSCLSCSIYLAEAEMELYTNQGPVVLTLEGRASKAASLLLCVKLRIIGSRN